MQSALGEYLYDQLALVGGLTLYGPSTGIKGTKRTGLVSFNCDTVHATDLSFFLDQEGVAVRTGNVHYIVDYIFVYPILLLINFCSLCYFCL